MPSGHPTPFPEGWIPIKSRYGWTAVRLRGNGGGVVGGDFPRTPDGKYVAFWRARKEVAEAIAGWAILSENEALKNENKRLNALLAQRAPSIPTDGLSEDISS